MRVSDEQLEACCIAHQDNPRPGGNFLEWRDLCEDARARARADMRAALEAIPDPHPGLCPDAGGVAEELKTLFYSPGGPGITNDWTGIGRLAVKLCAARLPAEVWDVLAEMRACGSDGIELHAVTQYADRLELALASTGQEAPKPAEPAPHLTPEAAARVLSGLTGGDSVLFPAEALAARVNAELGAAEDDVREALQSAQQEVLTLEARVRELASAPRPAESESPFETRADGQVVRKDRWETAFRAVASRFIGPREEFEVEPAMDRAIELVEKGLAAEKPAELAPRFHVSISEWNTADLSEDGDTGCCTRAKLNRVLAKRTAEPPPRELPSREQIAELLRQPFDRSNLYDAAMRVEALLREHAAPAVSAPARPPESPADEALMRDPKLYNAELLRLARLQWSDDVAEVDGFLGYVRSVDGTDLVKLNHVRSKWGLIFMLRYLAGEHAAPASGEAEALRAELAGTETRLKWTEGAYSQHRAEWDEQVRRYVAQVKGLEKRAQRAEDQAGKARCERDEALAKVAKLETAAQEAMRKADDHRRQRDEALQDRQLLRMQRDQLQKELAACQAEVGLRGARIEELQAELAARPEPIVVDEALAARIYHAWTNARGTSRAAMLEALRSVLGERFSVAAPEPTDAGDHWESLCQTERELREESEKECDKLRALLEDANIRATEASCAKDAKAIDCDRIGAELEQARRDIEEWRAEGRALRDSLSLALGERDQRAAERDQLRAELQSVQERLKGTLELADERANDKARVEHELLEARKELERGNSRANEAINNYAARVTSLGEQYEALRARLNALMEHLDDNIERFAQNRQVRDTYVAVKDRLEGALLQPATPEQQSYAKQRLESLGKAVEGATAAALAESRIVLGPSAAQPACDYNERTGAWEPDDDSESFADWVNASPADAWRPDDRHGQRIVSVPVLPVDLAADAEVGRMLRERQQQSLDDLHAETAAVIQRVADEQPIAKIRADVKALWRFVETLAEDPHYANTPERIGAFAQEALDARKAVDRG